MGFKPTIEGYQEDNWADKTFGVGWAGNDGFLDNPKCLIKKLLNDPGSGFAIIDARGNIMLNIPVMAATLKRCDDLGHNIALL